MTRIMALNFVLRIGVRKAQRVEFILYLGDEPVMAMTAVRIPVDGGEDQW
jgi:hypothetical protein